VTGAEEIQEQIDNLSADTHHGIRLIQRGLRLLATDRKMTIAQTQMVVGDLAAFDDGNLSSILPLLVQHLLGPDNARLGALPDEQRKTAQVLGEEYAILTAELSSSHLAADAIAALDTEGRHPAMTDAEREELSKKVAKKNDESTKRPRAY
jgi:hypothetical protein